MMLRWIGLAMALAGGLMAILALWGGWGDYWVLVLIGVLIFVVGMGALTHLGRGNGGTSGGGSGGRSSGGGGGNPGTDGSAGGGVGPGNSAGGGVGPGDSGGVSQ